MIIDDIWMIPFYRNNNQIASVFEENLNPADYVELIHSYNGIDASNFIDIFTEQGNVYISVKKI